MAYTKYSLTPSSNTAAPPDGAPEGMLPSAVNDTMRDMMAQIRDCGDGIRGGTYTMTAPVITGGSINGTTTITTSGAISYTGTLTGGTGVVNLGSGQFYKDASGNVGLGTASPVSVGGYGSLTLNGTTGSLVYLQTNASSAMQIATNASGASITAIGASLPLYFSTNSTERMRIDSSGNLLVGKTTASYPVAGRGVIEVGGSSESLLGFTIGASTTNAAYLYNSASAFEFNVTGSRYLFWTVNGAERMRITSGGELLVACTALPTGGVGGISLSSPATSNGMLLGTTGTGATNMIRFYNPNGNVGAITTSGSLTTYAVSSDYRLKENLVSLKNSKEFILSLKPKQGNWKADGSKFVGFVAHEFAETSPTSVIGEKDAVDEEGKPVYQSMQASSAEVMANLVALVQEQQAMIETLTTRLNALEGK